MPGTALELCLLRWELQVRHHRELCRAELQEQAGRQAPFPSTLLRSRSGGRPRNQLHLLAATVNADHPRRVETAGTAWWWEGSIGELKRVEKTAAFVLAGLCGKDAGG